MIFKPQCLKCGLPLFLTSASAKMILKPQCTCIVHIQIMSVMNIQIITLVDKMEKLRDFVLHPHIHSALERWLEGIRKVQARRKEEIVNATNRHRNVGNRHQEDKGTSGLLSRSVFIHLVAGDPMIVSPLDTIYIFDKDT